MPPAHSQTQQRFACPSLLTLTMYSLTTKERATYQYTDVDSSIVLHTTTSFMWLSWLPVHKTKTKTCQQAPHTETQRHERRSDIYCTTAAQSSNSATRRIGGTPQLLPPGPQWKRTETTPGVAPPPSPALVPGNRSPRNFSNLHDSWLPLSFRWCGAQSYDITIIPHRFLNDVNSKWIHLLTMMIRWWCHYS